LFITVGLVLTRLTLVWGPHPVTLIPSLYNALSQTIEPLQTLVPGQVSLYVCGPTVYDDAHLGHARCYLTWDFLVRALGVFGYTVRYARNVTDVDDKILNKAAAQNTTYQAIAERYYASFSADMAQLNILPPTIEPRATQHIATMIEATSALVNKGFAYACQDGTVYFKTQDYADYGQLSRRTADDMQAGARVDVDSQKQHPLDFALWKGVKSGASWTSPWGEGRPGWHIECSCMIRDVLGEQIDIHAGGADLMFPHHENERAQSEAWLGKKPFVQCWMHNGFVNVSGQKMSKSLGNFATVGSLLKTYTSDAVRYFVASHHYRMPVDFHEDALTGAQNWVTKAHRTWQEVEQLLGHTVTPKAIDISPFTSAQALADDTTIVGRFMAALADDMNTPKALAVLNEGLAELRRLLVDAGTPAGVEAVQALAPVVMSVWHSLGFTYAWREATPVILPHDALCKLAFEVFPSDQPFEINALSAEALLDELIAARKQAKQDKNWPLADTLRNGLAAIGITLQDKKDGVVEWAYSPVEPAAAVSV
jgi:cysteinyl-tRNA synthetase